MKMFFSILLLGCTAFIISCSKQSFQPLAHSNPWDDDYTNIAAMRNYKQWGTYNVHDPSCMLIGDTYYMYSTDAILGENREEIEKENLPFGYIQVRTSKDLVNWNFEGWVFNEIPQQAKDWVLEQNKGEGASNIWAPYILQYKDRFRIYFTVSAFAKQTSYIGLAESGSPLGPWEIKGCVVKTTEGDMMNAIDPSIVTNPDNGEQWMHYGSYFGGLYCVQINPETGLTLTEDDKGHLTARRFDGRKNNIEAPEIIYNPELKQYFLFVSYDPLMTTYNVRVGRSDKPEGPFTDFYGNDMREEKDNLPILTYPYQFENHEGWAGVGHCSVFTDINGKYYMAHQARLRPENHMMDLHVRQIFWTSEGWPVVSPQRYAGTTKRHLEKNDIPGNWEIISIRGNVPDRDLFAGQILWGENLLREGEDNKSKKLTLYEDGSTIGAFKGKWEFDKNTQQLILKVGQSEERVFLFLGQDWERQTETMLFTGLDANGYSLWGKKVNQ